MGITSGAKAPVLRRLYAALKGRSSTMGVLPQRLKPVLIQAETAGINACSTPRGKNFQGLKPQVFNAANGTTSQPSLAKLARPERSSRALTLVSSWTVLPQRLKPALIEAGTAGLKACSTPSRKKHLENKVLCRGVR
jgi:hypothetical protein